MRALIKLPLFAIAILLTMVVLGIFGPYFTPYDPNKINLAATLKPPSWTVGEGFTYIFGTDFLGRDLLSRLIMGARASMIVSLVGVGLAGLIGFPLGAFAAYRGGWFDTIVMRVVDIQMSMPAILLALLFSASLGPGLTSIIVVLALVYWVNYARVARGETLTYMRRDFVTLSKITGCSTWRIIRKHIFPNIIDTAVVVATLQIGRAVMLESALSFLGLGIQPPAIAWGKMIAESRLYLSTAWWLPTFPGLVLIVTVLGANLLGDWLRDKFDPQLRNL